MRNALWTGFSQRLFCGVLAWEMSNNNKAHLLTTSSSNTPQLPLGNLWYVLAYEYTRKLFNFAQFSKITWLYKTIFHEHSLRSYKVLQNTAEKHYSRLEKSSSHPPHWDKQDSQARVLDKNVAPRVIFFFFSFCRCKWFQQGRKGWGRGRTLEESRVAAQTVVWSAVQLQRAICRRDRHI